MTYPKLKYGDFLIIDPCRNLQGENAFPPDLYRISRDIVSCTRNVRAWDRVDLIEELSQFEGGSYHYMRSGYPPANITLLPYELFKLTKREVSMPTSECLCLNCNTNITDPDFRVILVNDDFPDVEIGPYCERCYGLLKVCSGCQRAVLAETTTHTGSGEHYCRDCMSSMSVCKECGSKKPSGAMRTIGDTTICVQCVSSKYFMCGCCSEYHKNTNKISSESTEGMRRAGIFRKYGKQVCRTCFDAKKRFYKLYDIRKCNNCGSNYSHSENNEGNVKGYCTSCWNSFRVCSHCSKRDKSVVLWKFVDENSKMSSKVLCKCCYDKLMYKCDYCNASKLRGNEVVKKIEGRLVTLCSCCSSAINCSNCDKMYINDPTKVRCSDTLCPNCYQYYVLNKCPDCNRVKDDRGRCRVCHHTGIYNYSLKPPIFYNYIKDREIKHGNIFFGFENECTYSNDSSAMEAGLVELYKAYDPSKLVAKSDGSISGYGYEVVSQPMSLMFFHGFDVSKIVHNGLKKSSSCGLHIHVGRKSFSSEVHLYKVINFLHNNKKFAVFIAGRDNNGYCCALDRKPSKHLKDSKDGRTERRCMVNLTNTATVEFRFFAGCTTESELRSRVEALHAIISHEKDTPISKSSSVPDFIKYLEKNSKMYPNAYELVKKFK